MDKLMEFLPFMLQGAVVTIELFALTIVISLPLGLPIALGSNSRIKPLSIICKIYVWIFRGTPLLLQLFFFYFFFPLVLNIQMNAFVTVVLTYVLNYAAYFAEIYRGGIASVPKGQYEAGQVLGMTKTQVFFRVILKQVIKRIVPPMSNEVITLVKDTSLARVVAVVELVRAADDIVAGYAIIWPLFYVGAFYLLFSGVLTVLFGKLEKKLDYYKG